MLRGRERGHGGNSFRDGREKERCGLRSPTEPVDAEYCGVAGAPRAEKKFAAPPKKFPAKFKEFPALLSREFAKNRCEFSRVGRGVG